MKRSKYQREYQKEKIKLGLCTSCGKRKIFKWNLCRKHYQEKHSRQMKYQQENKEAQKLRCAEFRKKNPNYNKNYYNKLKKGLV